MSTTVNSLCATLRGGNVLTNVMCSRLRGITSAAAAPMTKAQRNASASFDIQPYKLHKLDNGPAQTSSISTEEAIELYTRLQICRRLETGSATLYKEKVIRGFCHLYSGQEAIAVGMKAVLRPQDSVTTSYRCHAWTYLMDGTAVGVLAELTGRKSGCARGKGGSMHMYGKNFYGGNGIVGAQCPLGTGVAFAHKYKGDGGISFTIYGDGAANQGQLFEAMNIAKLWVLPCVFVCENNKYGLGTAIKRSSASTDYWQRGDYIPGIWVDGMDVLACKEAAKFAIEWCGAGKGPIVMEMETYRYYGHSMSDPGTSYRTREEVAEVRKTRDPITCFREKILSKNLTTPDKIKIRIRIDPIADADVQIDADANSRNNLQEIEKAAKKHIDEAMNTARSDPEVGVEELGADVYYENLENPIRGVRPDKPLAPLAISKRG